MSKTAFLFPGQGSQYVGMGQDLFEKFDSVKALYKDASAILGYDLAEVSFNGPEDKLKETVVTQPAILVHSLAWLTAVKENGEIAPDYTAGHSLGEYSALACAGVLSNQDAIKAVDTRCKAMQAACDENRGTMAAIIGLSREKVMELADKMKSEGVCVPANFNSDGQVAISGDYETVEKACGVAKEMGAKRALLLPVGGAFHSPLMKSAGAELAQTLESLTFNQPRCPVIANVTAAAETEPAKIRQLLVDQVTAPVLWTDIMSTLEKNGVSRVVEIGPGKVLSGLAKRGMKDVEIMNLDKLSDFDLVAEKIMEAV